MAITTQSEFSSFIEYTKTWFNQTLKVLNIHSSLIIFISNGCADMRCKVWSTYAPDEKTLINRLSKYFEKIYKNNKKLLDWVKIDIVYNIEKTSWSAIQNILNTQLHNNHYRKGVSFDEKFEVCFLEQEIYAKAIIKGLIYNEPNFWDEKNLNAATKAKYPLMTKKIELDKIQALWVFDTYAYFYEDGKYLTLQSRGPENGVRQVKKNQLKAHIEQLIKKNAAFLHGKILENGCFNYGYFPAYDREIKSYNTVRHCTAVYVLLETLEVDFKNEYLDKIKKSIFYAIRSFYKEIDQKGFMTDGVGNTEIKLGSNAAAIFMLAKYQEITGDHQFLTIANKLAIGIQYMVDLNGETTHVIEYPNLQVKEKFRIVYYDGEAALGLLRLYQLNQDPSLLDTVKLMFNHFIEKKYDQYHDHWLSYCANELTKICPEEKYFEFGINNYLKHMLFIAERRTAYATFLEMMMSAYKMVVRIHEAGFDQLYEKSELSELKKLIEKRVEFQRSTGFFYPEVAMYMAKPEKILNAFYVRHDRFRTRIDDQEHNLSGYIAYQRFFEI